MGNKYDCLPVCTCIVAWTKGNGLGGFDLQELYRYERVLKDGKPYCRVYYSPENYETFEKTSFLEFFDPGNSVSIDFPMVNESVLKAYDCKDITEYFDQMIEIHAGGNKDYEVVSMFANFNDDQKFDFIFYLFDSSGYKDTKGLLSLIKDHYYFEREQLP